MATSIHGLLDTANLHATKTDPTPAGLADAAAVVGRLGRALRLLVNDGLSQHVGGTASGSSPTRNRLGDWKPKTRESLSDHRQLVTASALAVDPRGY